MAIVCKVHGCRKHATRKIEILCGKGKMFSHFPLCEFHQDYGRYMMIRTGKLRKLDDGKTVL